MVNKLNVLGLEFTVREVPQIARGEVYAGYIQYMEQDIQIDSTMMPDRKRVALMHETIHAILNTYCMHTENENERLVQALALGLCQVLKDNKGAFDQ